MNKKTVYRDIEATKKNREHKDACAEVRQVRKPKREVSE